jgi:hypothetical protein
MLAVTATAKGSAACTNSEKQLSTWEPSTEKYQYCCLVDLTTIYILCIFIFMRNSYGLGMVVPLTREIHLNSEIQQLLNLEKNLREACLHLAAVLPSDPSQYPLHIGGYTIQQPLDCFLPQFIVEEEEEQG